MSVAAKEVLSIPQPEGEPIPIEAGYGAPEQYERVFKMLDGGKKKEEHEVAPHHIANVVQSAYGIRMQDEEVVQIARGLQAADEIAREVPNAPIIYRLHSEDAVAVTPDDATNGFTVVNTASEQTTRDHFVTSLPVRGSYRVPTTGSDYEHDEIVAEATDFRMFRPLTFLTTAAPEALDRFLNLRTDWMKYGNTRVIIGHEAVGAFLETQAPRELLTEEALEQSKLSKLVSSGLEAGGLGDDTINNDAYKLAGVRNSWAMLASAGLKRLGYDSPIGKDRDLVHRVGIRSVADIVAAGIGYGSATAKLNDYKGGNVLRRLKGVEFDLRADAQSAGRVATDLILAEEEKSTRSLISSQVDEKSLRIYLTETSGNFIAHILGNK
jgi:hypothetical protein